MLSNSAGFEIIAFTIIAKKEKKNEYQELCIYASPALHQHRATFVRRFEILLHVLISLSFSASLCSALQQMVGKPFKETRPGAPKDTD